MTYYQDRAQACQIIDDMVLEGRDEDYILFKIQTMFGYGQKFVKDRINLIHKFNKDLESIGITKKKPNT